MSKELCKIKKLVKKDLRAYSELVTSPNHICTKCGRAANDRKRLCSPTKIKN